MLLRRRGDRDGGSDTAVGVVVVVQSGGSKEGADVRGRPGSGGNYGRGGGRGGGGRGSSLPRFGSQGKCVGVVDA